MKKTQSKSRVVSPKPLKVWLEIDPDGCPIFIFMTRDEAKRLGADPRMLVRYVPKVHRD